MAFKFFQLTPGQVPEAHRPVQSALSKVSLLDGVVQTSENPDGTVVIYVRGSVDEHYERIVRFLRAHAPGVHGQIRKAPDAPTVRRLNKPRHLVH